MAYDCRHVDHPNSGHTSVVLLQRVHQSAAHDIHAGEGWVGNRLRYRFCTYAIGDCLIGYKLLISYAIAFITLYDGYIFDSVLIAQ